MTRPHPTPTPPPHRPAHSPRHRPTVFFAAAAALLVMIGVSASAGAAGLAAITDAPQLIAPAAGETVAGFGPTLRWTAPAGTTQYHLQVVPAGNDGPGINLIIGGRGEIFSVPPPPQWYGLLPDMSYTWRLRVSDAAQGLSEGSDAWGPWSGSRSFRTPVADSSTISLVSPANRSAVTSATPILTWANSNTGVYYYELQVSSDPGFGAGAFLYWELRHGGVASPPNSYTVPAAYPLQTGTTYYWRVRPRVQGDGRPVSWTAASSFSTAAPNNPPVSSLLQITSPLDESEVTAPSVQVTGHTRPGAIVTVNSVLASVDVSGGFTATISLESGPNEIEVLATDLQGNTARATLTVTYVTAQ